MNPNAMNSSLSQTAAPADAAPHRHWPLWRKIIAYLIFTTLASVSIWYVDRDVMRAQEHNHVGRASQLCASGLCKYPLTR